MKVCLFQCQCIVMLSYCTKTNQPGPAKMKLLVFTKLFDLVNGSPSTLHISGEKTKGRRVKSKCQEI